MVTFLCSPVSFSVELGSVAFISSAYLLQTSSPVVLLQVTSSMPSQSCGRAVRLLRRFMCTASCSTSRNLFSLNLTCKFNNQIKTIQLFSSLPSPTDLRHSLNASRVYAACASLLLSFFLLIPKRFQPLIFLTFAAFCSNQRNSTVINLTQHSTSTKWKKVLFFFLSRK